ncbi:NfeD family protein [Tuwongella immobilis]|uniref:NfeD-like C-terminal domain-containing protein n=1 Tax=Tuwongella immobilis TaxID=692036 RepID=A0A6C2YIU4_9BACT|nr:hypothetical protein [Tuwongella immobilis]VIP01468.1 Uncharacterized protein OS=Isosphaera pallida (strain ATCC 43644 / DSM 9630 / IS1B) GN=Isop_1695 PE=4 SV=1: NfeD [Tuwongella immobilis]VTR98496.1 Uncharacterized protein OS=Isosphaera pallida (strain ATCC 43644 / DSM 9630 / IS1B) GN=Isop_1695 PE=4 SV=1: NfeD [Tuwongella immobilis]
MDQQALAFVLIAIGAILLLAEVFLPTGGILFGVAMLLELVGVVLVFLSGDTTMGLITLAGVFIGIPALSIAAFAIWPYSPMARSSAQVGDRDDDLSALPGASELEQLVGRYGRTLSPLRPAGAADFDGRRVDVLSEGLPIEANIWVRCVSVKAGKVLVRQVDRPQTLDDLDSTIL